MKNLFLIAFFILGGITSINAQEISYNLTVQITGLNSDKGNLLVGIYTKEDNFLKKQFKGAIATIKNKKATVIFKKIPKGEYAISFIHDENDNKKMDTNFFGIPKEDYGCSNNAKGFMGPPKYNDAKFQLTEDKTISIDI